MKEEGKLDKFGRPNENTPLGWNPTKNSVEDENTNKPEETSLKRKKSEDKKEKKKKKKKKDVKSDDDVSME